MAYKELHILTDKQRRDLVQLAKVNPAQEEPFIKDVTCQINQYRLEESVAKQETPAAVAASIQQVINAVKIYMHALQDVPYYVVIELKAPLLTERLESWLERANEVLHEEEQLVVGHRVQQITERLKKHAWHLQRIACQYSSHLVLHPKELRRWLEEALIISGERPSGKNARKAYLDALALPD